MEHIDAGLDKHNVLAMLSRKDANRVFEAHVGVKYSDLVEIRGWKPVPEDPKAGLSIWLAGDELHTEDIFYSPIIQDVKATWCFSSGYLADAMKVFVVFDKETRVLSAKIASPLWIEPSVPVEKQKGTDLVILIAPRIPNPECETKVGD